ncbi:MAG: hypothetical protein JJT96_10885 [Opitutales bacterium]|nr:hypothetical protein [Opitutales bacterium]
MKTSPSDTPDLAALEERLSIARMRLQVRSPFLAALALAAPLRWDASIPTAATNGISILFNPAFTQTLREDDLEFVFAHEVLHIALRHPLRARGRDAQIFNFAADIVVNGMLAEAGWRPPYHALREPELERLSVEEVYAILMERDPRPLPVKFVLDLEVPNFPGDGDGRDLLPPPADLSDEARQRIEDNWREIIATAIRVSEQFGRAPAGWVRRVGEANTVPLPWRHLLWRYLVRHPTDYGGFDRRFVGRRLYLEVLEGERLGIHVCIDTSGSVDPDLLARFLAELRALFHSHPHLDIDLYYADAKLHGPFRLDRHRPPPEARGGGGTDFCPFFTAHHVRHADPGDLLVYLTDGFGNFPATAPRHTLLWAVPPGGAPDEAFPFGTVLRLVD